MVPFAAGGITDVIARALGQNILAAILILWCTVAPLSAALSAPLQGTAVHAGRSTEVTRSSARPSTAIVPAYRQRDMWQVIDQVGTRELGGARNTSRFRTQTRAPCVKPCSVARIK